MKTMTVETSQLSGAALDWAVSAAIGEHDDGGHATMEIGLGRYSPSTNWSQGGPLIEQYDATIIGASFRKDGEWARNLIAFVGKSRTRSGEPVRAAAYQERGEGHLVAFMRAIVAAELGDDVEVPAELMEANNA